MSGCANDDANDGLNEKSVADERQNDERDGDEKGERRLREREGCDRLLPIADFADCSSDCRNVVSADSHFSKKVRIGSASSRRTRLHPNGGNVSWGEVGEMRTGGRGRRGKFKHVESDAMEGSGRKGLCSVVALTKRRDIKSRRGA